MKKNNLLLTFLIAATFLLGGGVKLMAQESYVFTYGDDSNSNSPSYSPYGGYAGWEYNVYLYDATNVNFDGIISGVSFKASSSQVADENAHYTIYMKDVPSSTTLNKSTTFASYLDGSTQVISQTHMPAISTGWNLTSLTTNFNHERGNSILVMVIARGKTNSGGLSHSIYYKSNSDHVWYYRKYQTDAPSTSTTGDGLTSYLPSIKLTYSLVPCTMPQHLSATNISNHEATLSWASIADSWNLQYTSDGETWTTIENATNPYTLESLTSKTTYQFKVTPFCNGTPSEISEIASFTTLCDPYDIPITMGFESSQATQYSDWSIITDQASTAKSTTAKKTGSYGFCFKNSTNGQYLITPPLNTTTEVLISFYHKNTSETTTRTFKVGYSTTSNDVNTDFTWDESSTTATYNTWNEYTKTLPLGTKFIAIYSESANSLSYIYIDDISINVTSSINKPTDLSVSNVTYNSAQFNWTAGGSETSWKLQYKKTADADWTTVDVNSKPHTISTLDESSTYQWRIAAYIAPNMSDYEPGDNFTTPALYPAPTGLTTSNIMTYGASFTWDETTGADSYNLRYSVSGSESWTTVNGLTEETYTISSGLTGNTTYKVQVQAIYSGSPSAWTENSFTTLPIKRYTSTSITPTMNNWNHYMAWTPTGVPEITHDVVIEQNAQILSDNTAVANNVIINIGVTLTINSRAILTCNNITNNGTLIIEDGGQLICNNSVAATVQKSIDAWTTTLDGKPANWSFIASPISADLTPNNTLITDNFGSSATTENATYDFYYLNMAAGKDREWQNYRRNNFDLTNGMGYLYASKDGTIINFSGAIQPSNEPIEITGLYSGYNLVGNPFTCNAYLNRYYYTLNGDGSAVEVNDPKSAPIAPCTGVIIENSSVTFSKNSLAVESSNNGNVQLVLAQNVATRGESTAKTLDNAIISFNEGSQLGKFYFGSQDANLYIPMNNEEYAVVSSSAQGEMPVNFKAHRDGQYTITVNPQEVEMSYLHLIDNVAGKDIDLLATPNYTFNAKADDYESRFRLVFSANMVNTDLNDDFAFFSNGQLVIANEGESLLQVIDVNGRIVTTESVNGTCSKAINVKAGVYVLRLIQGTDVKTQKIVVR